MFALAIRIWRYALTIELGRVDEESTKDYEAVPLRQFQLGFTHDDEGYEDEQ